MDGPLGIGIRRGTRAAGVVRTVCAATVLLVFWALLAYAYRLEVGAVLFRVLQSARGVGAIEIESPYFDVRDSSSAGETLVRDAVDQLEADYAAIRALLGQEHDHRVPVLVTNGTGPAFTDGTRLNVFYDGQQIDLSTAPFLLVPLSEGGLSVSGLSLFVEGGFAVYVAEEIGRAMPLLGQPADAWVTWLQQNGGLAPLSGVWGLDAAPQVSLRDRNLPDVVRVLLQGGSFVRWVADAYGLDAVHDLRAGVSLEDVTGLSLPDAERAWLEAVSAKALSPKSCAGALPTGSLLRGFCDRWDRSEIGPYGVWVCPRRWASSL
jgi:hypothetical protein